MLFGYMWLRYMLIERRKAEDERHDRWESWKERMHRRFRPQDAEDRSHDNDGET
jgi:hypothetical protein